MCLMLDQFLWGHSSRDSDISCFVRNIDLWLSIECLFTTDQFLLEIFDLWLPIECPLKTDHFLLEIFTFDYP